MAEHGVENVRGGTFSQIVLPRSDLEIIERMMRGAGAVRVIDASGVVSWAIL